VERHEESRDDLVSQASQVRNKSIAEEKYPEKAGIRKQKVYTYRVVSKHNQNISNLTNKKRERTGKLYDLMFFSRIALPNSLLTLFFGKERGKKEKGKGKENITSSENIARQRGVCVVLCCVASCCFVTLLYGNFPHQK